MAQAALQSSDALAPSLDALKNGRLVLVYDSEGREEETDLVIASEFVSPDVIRHFRTLGGGLICTTLPPAFHESLRLPFLSDLLSEAGRGNPLLARLVDAPVPYEPGPSKPSFGLSINHRETFTGITDNDRALTITRLAALVREAPRRSPEALGRRFAEEFRSPGHVFLLNAQPGLVARRRGHTELSTTLLELAGATPTATICEMMNGPSGRALPKAAALSYARRHGIPFLTGAEIAAAWEANRGGPARRDVFNHAAA